jgi:hypothetical protein
MGTARGTAYVPGQAKIGPICEKAIASGMGNYLPNLVLYPGMAVSLQTVLVRHKRLSKLFVIEKKGKRRL